NGFGYARDPILKPLENIETRDALIDWSDPEHPVEAQWPDADVIIGNPPFLGAKLLRRGLGFSYVDELFRIYGGRLPGMSDLVAYWHEKARAMIEAGRTERAGLLATQSIRGGRGRAVLDRVKASGDIFLAWSDEPWVLDGANVHISFIGYDNGSQTERTLDGQPVQTINANLTSGVDLTDARRLSENRGIAFIGDQKSGPFDISNDLAQEMLDSPNPRGWSNRNVVRPWANGQDLVQRSSSRWIVDFGVDMEREDAALYEAPYEHVLSHVKPRRDDTEIGDKEWWLHWRPRGDMRDALKGTKRYVATPRVSRHRVFVWLPTETLLDSAAVAIAVEDDYTFGVLHSRVHELWARGTGTQLREVESGFRYTPTTTFETFPFPESSDGQREAISAAAKRLDELRRGWLNPNELAEDELKSRTLTNLYNEMPTWLRDIHGRLDGDVLEAYGWPTDISDDDLLARLLELNLERSAAAGEAPGA
ncbi:MAG: type IIL restriction-modification enzyme MmeI, partial [Chloroflexota bacterium]